MGFRIGMTLPDSMANIACPSASQGVCSTWTLESNTANGIGMLLLYVFGMVLWPQRFDKCVDHSNSLARISSNAVPVIVEDMSKKL